MSAELTPAQQKAAGLRAFADMLEANPDVADLASTAHLYVFHPRNPADHAVIARAALAHGAKVDKDVSDEQYNLELKWGPVSVYALASREKVCERVVTGTETITTTVPDPEKLAEVPTVEVTKTVETVEWVCHPLLATTTEAVRS